jgi:autotransporter-associated beta strand protein
LIRPIFKSQWRYLEALVNGKLDLTSLRRWSLSTSALAAISIAFIPTAAFADCLPSADGLTVICTTSAPNGYQAGTSGPATNGVTIFVQNATTVGGGAAPSPLLSVGTQSAINNEGTITAAPGGIAASLGGGSNFTNALTGTGPVTGDIDFGATDETTGVNRFNNFSTQPVTGNVNSQGDLVFTNSGAITGNVTSTGDTTITNNTGGAITGDITLGAGDDTINNTGTITGNVDMGGGDNVFNASTGSQLPSGSLSADADSNSVLNLLGSGANILNTPVTNFTDINVNTTGSWEIDQPVVVTDAVNVIAGTLIVPDADNLGANTVVNDSIVEFTNQADGTYSGDMSGEGSVHVDTGASTTTFSGSNTYTGGTFIDGGTLSVTGGEALLDTGDVFIGAGGTLDVETTQTIGGLNDDGGAGGAVTLTAGNLIINDGSFSGAISGADGIEKIGTGTLTLSGANTFAGPAVVTDGTLVLQNGAAIGDTTEVIVNATDTTSGTLEVDDAETIGSLAGNGGSVVLDADLTTGGDNTSTSYAGVISGTGGLVKDGTGTFVLSGANTYSGGTIINAGTLQGTTTSIQGDITDNAAGTLDFEQDTDGTYAGAISGAGAIVKGGAGLLTLTGDNSGSSGTFLVQGGGGVSIGAANNIGTGAVTINGATFQTTGVLTLANAFTLGAGGANFDTLADTTLNGVISGGGHLTKTGGANLILGGANTYSGGTLISAGTLTGTTTSLQGDIENDSALVFNQPAAGTYAGILSGTGSVSFTGAGNVTLTGANTYSGATNIAAGTVTTTGTGIGDASDVTVATGATLSTSGDEVIGSLSGGGTVTTTDSLTTGGNGNSTTFGGSFTAGELIKTGAGTMTLTGASTPSGGLTVNGGGLTIATTGTVDTGASDTTVTGAALTVDGVLTTTELDANAGSNVVIDVGGIVNAPVVIASSGLVRDNGTVNGDVGVGAGGTLMGAGVINGNVTNSGTVAPGNSPGIITVAGNYTQTAAGTLAAELTPSTVPGTGYDQLHATGTATLDGTLALMPSTGLYVAGSTYDVVVADAGITGNFATVTGNVISPFLTFTPTIVPSGAGQALELTVVRTNYAVGIQPGATPNQIATANGFQNLVPGATGDTADLVVGVDNMTAAQARLFFDEASPEPYGAYATAMQDQGDLFTRQVGLHMQDAGAPNGARIWGHGYYSWGSGSSQSYRYGSDANIGGGVIGADFSTGNFVLGAAVGYATGDIDYQLGNSNGHSNSWQIGGYANYLDGPFNADLQVAYVDSHNHAIKGIDVGTVLRVADARFGGNLVKVVGTVGYNTDLDSLTLRPFIGVDYMSGNTDSFTEHGAGSANLTVGEIDADKTNLMIGVDLIPSMGELSPYGRLAYAYDVNNDRRNISAFFAGDPTSAFTVSGVRPSQSEFDIDAGLNYTFAPGASAFVGYQGALRGDLNQNGVVAGITISFGEEAAPPPPPPPAPPPPPPPPPPAPVKTFIVFFDFNKSDITDKAQQVIAEAVRLVKASGFVKILVTGHTDTVGSDSYNQALSIRRAQSVKDEMTREGVDGSGIAIEGKSFHDPLVPTGPDVREPQNRRAVIDLGG